MGHPDHGGSSRRWLKWPSRTLLKYLVVQVPGWLLLAGIGLFLGARLRWPDWALAVLLALAVLKDLALYPLLRQAYEGDPRTGAERLVGFRGSVAKALRPQGYIRVRGELWHAEVEARTEAVPEGARVTVRAARGLTLTVEPD